MGNQQATGNLELAWLGGIMDGEGCFSLSKRMRKGKLTNYNTNIIVSNSDPRIIERAHLILEDNGIGHYVNWKTPGDVEHEVDGRKFKRSRQMGEVRVFGLMRCKKFCEAIIPYVFSKQDQAKALLEFIELRLGKGPHYGAIAGRKDTSYGDEEHALYMRLKELKIPAAPETTRRTRRHGDANDGALPYQREDIVRPQVRV